MSGEFAYRNEIKNLSKTYVFGVDRNKPPIVIVEETKKLVEAGIDIDKLVSILPRGWSHKHVSFKNIPNLKGAPDCESFFPPKNRKKLF